MYSFYQNSYQKPRHYSGFYLSLHAITPTKNRVFQNEIAAK
ncbi:hypothetical protein HMPREF0476_1456 [Kingella kingae ATCC 23330]|uniref:Uncharacterized protein n=1 Tax=Kingella kingae ATCC 23330 TaxID=887327 RepID=F5S8C5_KINKI|nr:hypothetical protein HMPREF0476_1456 [Kingella kingae ATCC 23330]